MSEPDFTDYEKRRAAHHEELCRIVSTFVCIDWCNLRACRRRRLCSGPMRPSAHQAGAVRAQREIGLSGQACASLPLCIANRNSAAFQAYRECMDEMRQLEHDNPEVNLLWFASASVARRRSWPGGS